MYQGDFARFQTANAAPQATNATTEYSATDTAVWWRQYQPAMPGASGVVSEVAAMTKKTMRSHTSAPDATPTPAARTKIQPRGVLDPESPPSSIRPVARKPSPDSVGRVTPLRALIREVDGQHPEMMHPAVPTYDVTVALHEGLALRP